MKIYCGKCTEEVELRDNKLWCENCGCCVVFEFEEDDDNNE